MVAIGKVGENHYTTIDDVWLVEGLKFYLLRKENV